MEALLLIIVTVCAALIGVMCRRHALQVYGRWGGPEARFQLGTMFLKGTWVARDSAAALEWFRLAAAAGHLRAPLVLGMMLALGDGVERNPVLGYAWLVLGSRRLPDDFQGEVAEQIEILEGELSPQQLKAGEKVIGELTAEVGGPERAAGKTPGKRGFVTLFSAAEAGLVSAQCVLGEKYFQAGDFEPARQWFEKAAAQNNPDALFRLGEMYKFGRGAPLDQVVSTAHLKRAAALGHAQAALALAGTWNTVSADERQQQLAELRQAMDDLREEINLGQEEAERMLRDPAFAEQKKREGEEYAALLEEIPHLLRAGNRERIQQLLDENRISANLELGGGRSLLYVSAQLGQLEIVRLLLERGADPAIETLPDKFYPLHAVATNPDNRHADGIARLLIEFHRNRDEVPPDLRSEAGTTPLMLAANTNLPKLVEVLIAAGADPNARDQLGLTPLHYAVDGRAKATTLLLLKAGADPTARCLPGAPFGAETVIEAARRFAPELVCLLGTP